MSFPSAIGSFSFFICSFIFHLHEFLLVFFSCVAKHKGDTEIFNELKQNAEGFQRVENVDVWVNERLFCNVRWVHFLCDKCKNVAIHSKQRLWSAFPATLSNTECWLKKWFEIFAGDWSSHTCQCCKCYV